jgi:hypothetical protein
LQSFQFFGCNIFFILNNEEGKMGDWNQLQVVTDVSLTYSSASSPIFIVSTSSDLTGTVSLGMRLRVTQSTGGTKYFIVVAISSSTITLYGGTDYVLNNEAINSPVFSAAKVPFGFNIDPLKWTVSVTDTSQQTQATPSQNTWYNLGSLSLAVPIGSWSIEYFVTPYISKVSTAVIEGRITLSTTNNSETDMSMTTQFGINAGSARLASEQTQTKRRHIILTSATTYYLNTCVTTATPNETLYNLNEQTQGIVRAVCAYL